MKLSQRLQYLDSLIPNDYQHIWDCCCDHGFLGTALLERNAAPYIHFVDIVPDLIYQLQQRLELQFPNSQLAPSVQLFPKNQLFPKDQWKNTQSAELKSSNTKSKWSANCQDVAQIALEQYSGKQLVIIAGIGGDLMTDIVSELHKQFSHLDIDFLLCPVYQQFLLRNALIDMKMTLKSEHLVKDKGRIYEIMWVSQQQTDSTRTIHPAGETLWQTESVEKSQVAHQYLNKTLNHYQRMQLNAPSQAKQALELYSQVQVEVISE